MPEYYYGAKITLTASPVRRVQWRDIIIFYPGHLTLCKVFLNANEEYEGRGVSIQIVITLPLVRLMAAN